MAAMTDAASPTLDWPRIANDLNAQGWAVSGPLLTPATCDALRALYDQPERFRSRIVMQRHGFGQGEYQYFDNPLPDPLPRLRARLYEEPGAHSQRLGGAAGAGGLSRQSG